MDGRAAAMPEPLHSPSGCHGHGTPLVPPVDPSSQPHAADAAAAPPAWNEEVVDWAVKAPRSPAQEPAAADAKADAAAPSPTPAAATVVLGERVRGGGGVGGGGAGNEVVVPNAVSRSRAGKFADASAAAAARLNYSRATAAAAAACQQPVRPVRTPSAGPSAGKRPRVSPAYVAAPLPGWNSSTSLRAAAVAAAAANGNGNGNGADGGGGSRAPPALSSVARRSVSTRVLSHSSPTLPSPRDDPRIVNTQAARKPFSSRSRLGVPGCEAGAGYAAATGASSARAKRGAAAAAAAASDAPSYLTADSKDKGSARRSRTTELPAIVSGRGRGVSTGAKEQDGKAGQRLQWFGPPGEVVPGLWVGSMEHASPKAVEKHGFTSVFSIMRYSVFGGPPTYGNAVEFHNYPFCDNGTDSIPFAEIAERINEALAKSMRYA